MNKQELIKEVAQLAGFTQVDAAKAVSAVIKAVSDALAQGDEVRLIGFGTFKRHKVASRTVRNPRNGQPVQVPAMHRVKFAPGLELRKAANS